MVPITHKGSSNASKEDMMTIGVWFENKQDRFTTCFNRIIILEGR